MVVKAKKLTKKAKKLMKVDIVSSVALVSVLINLFFFSGVILFNSTNRLDESLYNASVVNLCHDNYQDNLTNFMNESTNKAAAKANFEIQCRSGDFGRFYNNAVDAFLKNSL